MVVIRPTLSLAKHMKIKVEPTDAESTTRLGDWYATDVVFERKQLVLLVSSTTRLGILMKAAPYITFPERFPDVLSRFLLAIGITGENIEAEIDLMKEIRLAKAVNRSITGTMNDYSKHLRFVSGSSRLKSTDPHFVSLWISETPSLVMEPSFPKDAALKVFDQVAPAVGSHSRNPFLYLVQRDHW